MGLMILALAGCAGFNLFGAPKIKEEEIIPPETLYTEALGADGQPALRRRRSTTLEKLERQHPYLGLRREGAS